MTRQTRRFARQAGLSLVELMITLVLAILVTLGILTLMNNVGITNRVQDGMARMQENGRYALQRISNDLHAASSQFCTNFASGTAYLGTAGGTAAETYLERGRPLVAHYNLYTATDPGGNALHFGPSTFNVANSPNNTYLISPRWMLFGTECGPSTCVPSIAATDRAIDTSIVATMGVAAGNRARGADTISIRYIRGSGVPVTSLSNNTADGNPVVAAVDTNALGITNTTVGDVLITDCAMGEIIRARAAGGTLTATGNFNDDTMQPPNFQTDVRAFNLRRDLVQVSYFLQVKDDPSPPAGVPGRKIVSLMRSENGDVPGDAQEIVEGVERLDFTYAVDDQYGRTRYLTADQVDALAADCPPSPATPSGYLPANNYFGATEPGCGWRAVKSVEVSLLMNTVTDASVNGDDAFRYSYTNTGAANTANTFEIPSALGTLRNGLPPYRMLRREFRTQVNVRGYNY